MVSYDFYAGEYMGSLIPEKKFPALAARAEGYLDRFRRTYRMESAGKEAEAMAVCAMAETLCSREKTGGGMTAASAGRVSVRYGEKKRRPLLAELYEQASDYVDFYRGAES